MLPSRQQALRDMGLTPWRLRDEMHSGQSETVAPPVAAVESGREALSPPSPVSAGATERSLLVEEVPAPGKNESIPTDWAELEVAVASCRRCVLAQGRKQTVFGVGARDARWLLVGEAPGAEEDRRGEPFVGRAGRLLDAMLHALGLKREDVFITNIVKCRPPANRDPEPEEAAACRSYLDKQIEWVEPRLIIALGRVAAQQLLDVDTPVGRLRGRVHEGPRATPVVVTYHPAYLLRTPIAKRKVWDDLKLALATARPTVLTEGRACGSGK